MTGAIKVPQNSSGIFRRVDNLSRAVGHHIILNLAKAQKQTPRIDLCDPLRSGLPPHAHIMLGHRHLFALSGGVILTGRGAGRFVQIDPLVLKMERYLQLSDGALATMTLRSKMGVTQSGQDQMLLLIDGAPILGSEDLDPRAERARRDIFNELALWQSSLDLWCRQNPDQSPPALLMPDPNSDALLPGGIIYEALQEAADVTGLLAARVPEIRTICLGICAPAPRQDGIDPDIGLAVILEMSAAKLLPAQLAGKERRKIVARKVIEAIAGSEILRFRQMKPAWEASLCIPKEGRSWPTLQAHSKAVLGGHRRLSLETRWASLLVEEKTLEIG